MLIWADTEVKGSGRLRQHLQINIVQQNLLYLGPQTSTTLLALNP